MRLHEVITKQSIKNKYNIERAIYNMRFREILEARKNPAVNNERNGRAALFDYLESLDSDELERTYVHFSTTAKLGINPNMIGTGENFEPIGIFTYPARAYIRLKGGTEYAGTLPIAHVITIKPEMHTVYREEDSRGSSTPKKLYAKLRQEYPNIKYGTKKGRFLSTKYLISQGYNLIFTLGAWPSETVILNPKAIEKDKIITVEFLHPNEKGIVDGASGHADWEWFGPANAQGSNCQEVEKYRKIIADKQILSRTEEYYILKKSPGLHKEYVDQVLTPQGLQSKLSAQEIQSIAKKHKAARNRGDNSNPIIKLSPLRPSMMSAKRLFDYGAKMINQGKQLSKSQEKTLAQKGAVLEDGVDLLPIYYKLLQDAGMSPLLTATELEQARRMVPDF